MHPSAKPVAEIFLFNNALFELASESLNEAESETQLAEHTNSIKWLMGHCVAGRVLVCSTMGVEIASETAKLYSQPIHESPEATHPTLDELNQEWKAITRKLLPTLASMTEQKLKTAPPETFPTAESTTIAALAFLAQHESYHLGQISYIRRQLGKKGLVDLLLS